MASPWRMERPGKSIRRRSPDLDFHEKNRPRTVPTIATNTPSALCGASPMQYAEALREVKKAEAEVRDLKADAQKQAVQILRDAERQANQLLEQARKQADEAYANAVEVARVSAEKARAQRLAAGDKDAAAVRARANGPDFQAALNGLLANFERHATTGK